jgi:ribose/xylose/arabinose/galactoside ABC-type transport system permease subunit
MFVRFLTHNPSRLYLLQCLLFLAILTAVFVVASPFFLSLSNIDNILTASAVIGLIAMGATFVIASGGIDLSSAAVMAFAGTVCASVVQNTALHPLIAVLIAIGVGGACGFTTGLLINLTRAPSFIVTLGMLSVARAAAYIISHGMPIYGLPERIISTGQGNWAGVPVPVVLLLLGIGLAWFLLAKTRFGLHTLIFGDNALAAEATGINVARLRLKVFTLAGLYSGLAGFVFMARTNSGDPTAGQNYELIAITAVILGGANLFGGRATIIGTVLGVLCLGILQNGLNLLAVSTYYQILFVGIVLLAAAFLSRVGQKR